MASAMAAALPHLRLRVVATASSSPSSSSYYSSSSPSYSCRLFLHPALRTSTRGLACCALSLRTRRHSLFAREKKGRNHRNVVVASLFGVGAPEALVIGVVALLVFGPKGLAEVARNLGKTLREFQPTIRELQEVSKEFKSTLEREIGLDEMASSSPTNYNNSPTGTTANQSQPSVLDPNGKPPSTAYSSEELLKVTEEQLAASASASASASTATATADAPPSTTDSQVPKDTADSSKSSDITPPDAVPVETAAVATSSEGIISESSSETSEKEKTTE